MIVRIIPGEHIERALARFKKGVQKEGIVKEACRRAHYEKPSVRRKKKSIAARLRLRKFQEAN